MRHAVLGLLFLGLTLAAAPADEPTPPGQDDPPKLKKKQRPVAGDEDRPLKKPEHKLGEKGEDDPKPGDAAQPAADPEELLRQVLKNSRKAEDRIAGKQVDDATKQLQRDVVAGIDELLKQAQQPPQGGQGGGQQGQQSQPGGQGSQQSRGQRGQRGGGTQSARGQGQGQGQGQQSQPGQGQGQGQSAMGGGGGQSEEAARLAEVYKDIWGHLPESLRQEMNAYSREMFMDKYRDQLKRYYSTIAEKGQK